jgi:Na+-driven multidrug efflux pump
MWTLIKLGVKGEESNILSGNINRAIILLAIPMMLEMVMESLFAVVDIFFVSKIGVNSIAVVGLTESLLTIIYSVAIGLSMGATAMVARRVGEKKYESAATTGIQAIYFAVFISIILAVPGLFYPDSLLRLMGAGEDVIAEGTGFIRLMIGGNVIIMLLF